MNTQATGEATVVWFENLGMNDVDRVGGKNASLGEMTQHLAAAGVNVPGGFATTAAAYREFLAHEGLADRINTQLSALDINDVTELARVGKAIREEVIAAPFPANLEAEIRSSYEKMMEAAGAPITVAVRSSATAEDLPDASFAG